MGDFCAQQSLKFKFEFEIPGAPHIAAAVTSTDTRLDLVTGTVSSHDVVRYLGGEWGRGGESRNTTDLRRQGGRP